MAQWTRRTIAFLYVAVKPVDYLSQSNGRVCATHAEVKSLSRPAWKQSDWRLPNARIRGWPYWVTASHNLIAEVHAVTTLILELSMFCCSNLPPVLRLTWLTPISRSLVRTTIIPSLSLCPYALLTNRFNTLPVAHDSWLCCPSGDRVFR